MKIPDTEVFYTMDELMKDLKKHGIPRTREEVEKCMNETGILECSKFRIEQFSTKPANKKNNKK